MLQYGSGGSDGTIALDRIYNVRQGLDLPSLTQQQHLEFQFTLTGSNRVIRLRAATAGECMDWLAAIRKYAGGGRSSDRTDSYSPRSQPLGRTASSTGSWRSARDPQGREYWYNKDTRERSWHPPGGGGGGGGGGYGSSSSTMGWGQGAGMAPQTQVVKSVYSDAHDPPAPGPKILDLHVRQPGFFGVYLDEVADMSGRTHVCVQRVEPGSEAHKQCPQLVAGMFVHTVQRRAVGKRLLDPHTHCHFAALCIECERSY